MGSERSEGVGNTGWWKNHMYQWGLERRSDNIDVLRSAPERSGVAPEWGRSAPERSGVVCLELKEFHQSVKWFPFERIIL